MLVEKNKKTVITKGNHNRREREVTMNNVTVSFLSLFTHGGVEADSQSEA